MEITIGNRKIGDNHSVFIIAEMSGNHNQSYDRALRIIDASIEAGVDAIKLQTYTADTITIDSDKEYFQVKDSKLWAGKSLHQLYQMAYTPWEWQPKLKKYAESKGVMLFSTPFDPTAVDFLQSMNVVCYKVASFEIVDIPLLQRIGQTKRAVIMSRGMASLEEIELAIKTLRQAGTPHIALLHCISAYPSQPSDMNLNTIPDMKKRFGVVVGLSDHTLGDTVAIASIPLGARIIEKHVTLKRSDGGPDAAFSLEPDELKRMVRSIRDTEQALGKVQYGAIINEKASIVFRKSLFVVKDIKKGEVFTKENIRCIRPGHGLNPKHYDEVLGKIASQDIERGTPLSWEIIQ